ncbi:hypothetical protein ABZ897_50150 [Nonomuraea sp. NPDC046802]|uniref:hypothetical protein n=1 Tax=Nonomuraea sp. NPDC046802 TaxID=3154919 RepID=UPI0033FEC64D
MRQHQAVPEAFTTIHAAYAAALKRAPLDGDNRRAWDSRVRTFLAWLEASGLDGDPLTDVGAGDALGVGWRQMPVGEVVQGHGGWRCAPGPRAERIVTTVLLATPRPPCRRGPEGSDRGELGRVLRNSIARMLVE